MTLHLDARQRAMLQEMGVALPLAPVRAPAAVAPPAAAQPRVEPGGSAPPRRAEARPPAPPVAEREAAQPAASAPAQPSVPATMGAQALLAPPIAPYAPDPQDGPAEPGGWLVLLECAQPGDPLAGDAGLLLDNMLRAMRLHHQRNTHVAALLPADAAQRPGVASQAAGQPLADVLATLRPAMVLLLGRGAARAVLGSPEPLAQLRSASHRLADGTLAAVSHDPAYLLHAQDAKAAAWLDLCRALAWARAQA